MSNHIYSLRRPLQRLNDGGPRYDRELWRIITPNVAKAVMVNQAHPVQQADYRSTWTLSRPRNTQNIRLDKEFLHCPTRRSHLLLTHCLYADMGMEDVGNCPYRPPYRPHHNLTGFPVVHPQLRRMLHTCPTGHMASTPKMSHHRSPPSRVPHLLPHPHASCDLS